ncbi:probable G-protein coupled receptor Mth-like 10 [Camponotus floridanus]|uniref:probable G-protein coupled receptor Mth-like 10 n=1 Tax=Camponotus floridanus TaxID=104421 RepID=UPI000DC6BDBF|nr:probable G-protein coupled receptor Mth-like 10 [Camponotus floridanus]
MNMFFQTYTAIQTIRSLYLPYFDIFVESTSHCLAVVDHNQFDAIICLEAVKETIDKKIDMIDELINDILDEELHILFLSSRIMSVLCLLTTFVVYSILPELRNIHSFMLRKYCTLVGYFCLLSSFFWLSAMSFDVWWTFRDFRSLQRNKRAKQERKKLIYSIFAWGGPFIFTIICIIMDFVPNVPENLIRPELCVDTFWFNEEAASRLYFDGPRSVCIINSVCLSIYTAWKIMRYEKDTARRLRDSESRFYNDNKRWLNLYLRLYIMLFLIIAINWIISTVHEFWQFDDYDINLLIKLSYVYHSMFVMDTMQDIGIFIIFVCKKTILRQLLKRFCQNCKRFSKTLT